MQDATRFAKYPFVDYLFTSAHSAIVIAGVLLACLITTPAAWAVSRPEAPAPVYGGLHGHNGHDAGSHGAPDPSPPFYDPGYRGLGPQIGIDIAPQTEHWPSNFLPDGYRLNGYDGRPDSVRVCRGDSGRTITTGNSRCPQGQQPSQGGRSLSTDHD